jgi:aryl-alcohol dehydrogenase-like predicted oxidoreductase
LGTVQFGMDYGIANTEGRTSAAEVTKILTQANNLGIHVIDTAAMYGDSEAVIGRYLPKEAKFDIVTKTPALDCQLIGEDELAFVRHSFLNSLKKMRQEAIHGLLVHHCDDLRTVGAERLFREMQVLKDKGKVKKIGFSASDSTEIDYVLERFPIDLIQIPANVFDQRLLSSGMLGKLNNSGIEIHVRSVFLQGLLLMNTDKLPSFFDDIREQFSFYMKWLRSNSLSPIAGALKFASQLQGVDQIVVGICDSRQLAETSAAYDGCRNIPNLDFSQFALDSERYLNPSNWVSS